MARSDDFVAVMDLLHTHQDKIRVFDCVHESVSHIAFSPLSKHEFRINEDGVIRIREDDGWQTTNCRIYIRRNLAEAL